MVIGDHRGRRLFAAGPGDDGAVGFQYQIADGQDQPGCVDDDAAADTLGPEDSRRSGVVRDPGLDADHGF